MNLGERAELTYILLQVQPGPHPDLKRVPYLQQCLVGSEADNTPMELCVGVRKGIGVARARSRSHECLQSLDGSDRSFQLCQWNELRRNLFQVPAQLIGIICFLAGYLPDVGSPVVLGDKQA